MKKLIFPVGALFFAVMLSTAGAQEKKYEIVLGGGIDSPLSPQEFSDGFELGFTAKAAAGYFLTPQFVLGANFSYNRFGLDKNYFLSDETPGVSIEGGAVSVYEIAGVGKYYFMAPSQTLNFYVLGGPGVAFSRVGDVTVTGPGGSETITGENTTDFLLTGGVGATYQLNSRWSLFIEGRYSNVFASEDNVSYLPIRVGVVF